MEDPRSRCRTICDLFYAALHIPMYVYENGQLQYTPVAEAFARPPRQYLAQLLGRQAPIYFTEYGACFARLDVEDAAALHLILGPVSALPPQSGVLPEMYRDYGVPAADRAAFRAFQLQLPTMTHLDFFHHLLPISYALNRRVLPLAELTPAPSPEDTVRTRQKQAETMFRQRETASTNNSLALERVLLAIVRAGNVEELRRFAAATPSYQAGVIAETPLRLQKNYFISTITLTTRAAIEGGLPEEQAFRFSDLYITKAETLSDLQAVNTLFLQALQDLTMQVHARRQEQLRLERREVGRIGQLCMDYVQKHTHSPLTVQGIADALGYHRSYLSAAFSRAAGVSLREYIYRCKLEESVRLLQYTSKSISEISSALYFSNQSHFVQRFKKRYGLPPAQFRAEHRA